MPFYADPVKQQALSRALAKGISLNLAVLAPLSSWLAEGSYSLNTIV